MGLDVTADPITGKVLLASTFGKYSLSIAINLLPKNTYENSRGLENPVDAQIVNMVTNAPARTAITADSPRATQQEPLCSIAQ